MKNQTIMNRKSAKKLLMVQWSRFQNVCIELEGSTLVTVSTEAENRRCLMR